MEKCLTSNGAMVIVKIYSQPNHLNNGYFIQNQLYFTTNVSASNECEEKCVPKKVKKSNYTDFKDVPVCVKQ